VGAQVEAEQVVKVLKEEAAKRKKRIDQKKKRKMEEQAAHDEAEDWDFLGLSDTEPSPKRQKVERN
jgi:hypothetical protein